MVFIGVPDMDRYFDIRQLQNAHVLYFTPRTFKYYMDICGLTGITFGAHSIHMYGIFEVDKSKLELSFLKNE